MDKKTYYPNKRKPKITLSTVKLPLPSIPLGTPLIRPYKSLIKLYETCVFFAKEEKGSEILERYDSELEAFIGHKKWSNYIESLDDLDYIDALFELEDIRGTDG